MYSTIVEDSDERIIALAEPLVQNLLDGAEAQDYGKFSRDFSHSMKSVMPHDLFMEQTIGLHHVRGKCTSRKPLGVLRKNKTVLVLWSARYEKTEDDMLIQLKLVMENGKLVISSALIT